MSGTNWNTFAAGQTTSALKINENFDWLEGHLIPQVAGVGATNTHDIGSATYKFKSGYFGTGVYINGKLITGIDTVRLDFNGGAMKLKTSSVRGSTANSGGSAQEIAQGTISTPDIRDNATVQSTQTSLGSDNTGSTLTTKAITTLGGNVLVMGKAAIQFVADAGATTASIFLAVDRDGTAVTGTAAQILMTIGGGASATHTCWLQVCGLDSPSAGTYNYNLRYRFDEGTFDTCATYNLTLLELRK